mgnify:CR=1 FL=1
MEGIINKDATVLGDDGNIYNLPIRGEDEDSYKEVLIDAKSIGLSGWMHRQSVKPLIGKRVKFVPQGVEYNYEII